MVKRYLERCQILLEQGYNHYPYLTGAIAFLGGYAFSVLLGAAVGVNFYHSFKFLADFWFYAGCLAATAVATMLHECGHASAAVLLGLGVERFRVGDQRATLMKLVFKGCSFNIGLPLSGGRVVERQLESSANWKIRLFAIGGPAAEFLAALTGLICYYHYSPFFLAIFTRGVVCLIGTALPERIPAKMAITDGYAFCFPEMLIPAEI